MIIRCLTAASLLAGLANMTPAAGAEKFWAFIGTGTGSAAASRGVYRCEFDPATGTLGEPQLAAEVVNPTFLAVHPTRKVLYCIGEVATSAGKKAGGLHAFTLDSATGKLSKLNEVDSSGPGPCHLVVDSTGQCILVANYSGGSVKCIALNADGSFGEQSSFFQHEGKGPNARRQEGPHAHSVNISADNRFAIVADLGIDKLMIYRLDAKSARLEPNDPPSMELAPGSGPRHFAWHPTGKMAYVNGELDASVSALKYDATTGRFSSIGTAPTLPAELPDEVRRRNTTAEVVVHPNAGHVFVSNRGHDSIAVFKLTSEGVPQPAGHITGGIRTPRNFVLDPTGQWLLVANQDSNDIAIFRWSEVESTATARPPAVAVPRPMCIRFVPRG